MNKFCLLVFVLLLLAPALWAQSYFQGEILYAVKYKAKKPTTDLTTIPFYPSTRRRMLFKEGSWFMTVDTSRYYKYDYFDPKSNREYWRYKFSDTLFYFNAAELNGGPDDSLVSTRIIPHADTILGRVCNRYVLRTNYMTLSLSYDPAIVIDPAWFAASKLNYYDVVYKAIRSLYLKMVFETGDFVVMSQAIHIERRWVLSTEFPPLSTLPTKAIPN